MTASRSKGSTLVLSVILVVMLLPVIATAVNAIATDWSGTLLPSGITSQYFVTVLTDPRFHKALARSLAVAAAALSLATVVIVPAIVAAHVYWPKVDKWMARLVILPYAVPGIILTVGYLRIFSAPPLRISGTPLVLVLAYVPACFPIFYITVKNNLRSLQVRDLLDAGHLIGASDFAILRRVVLPCIVPGIAVAVILNFAGLLSEFVYAKMLVGGDFQTLQMYMYGQRNASGRISSVIVVLYFAIVVATTLVALRLVDRSRGN